jgi:hypothetical protein
MKIFISWSGVRSHQVATFLQGMLRQIFEGIEFYLSSDMERGVRWSDDIFTAMAQCNIGVVVFTPENKFESWVMFEAGSLWRGRDSVVIPVYVDCTFHSGGPFREFQAIRLETQKSEDSDLRLQRNIRGLTRLIETIAGRMPGSVTARRPLRLSYLTDLRWWDNQESLLVQSAKVFGEGKRPDANNMDSEPAEETPVLAYPKYKSNLTFEAMTNAVRETTSTISICSVGLWVYATQETFRDALNEKVKQSPDVRLKVVLLDPTSPAYKAQHRQMSGSEYKDEDLFTIKDNKGEQDLMRKYRENPSTFGINEAVKFIPNGQALHHFAKLCSDVSEEVKRRISLRLYGDFLPSTVVMFDHVVYMFPYGVSHDALTAPLFRFLPGQIGFNYFRGQFEAIYNISRDITTGGT